MKKITLILACTFLCTSVFAGVYVIKGNKSEDSHTIHLPTGCKATYNANEMDKDDNIASQEKLLLLLRKADCNTVVGATGKTYNVADIMNTLVTRLHYLKKDIQFMTKYDEDVYAILVKTESEYTITVYTGEDVEKAFTAKASWEEE